jgi:hypothetical protein
VSCRTISERGSPAPSHNLASWWYATLAEYLTKLFAETIIPTELHSVLRYIAERAQTFADSRPGEAVEWDLKPLPWPGEATLESVSCSGRLEASFHGRNRSLIIERAVVDSVTMTITITAEVTSISWTAWAFSSPVGDLSDTLDPAEATEARSCSTSTVSCIAYQILFDQFINSDAYQQ